MKEVKIIIPSSTEFVEPIMNFFNTLLLNKNMDDAEITPVITSIIEALANAIVHGNGSDPSKKVELIVKVAGKKLTIEVFDQGRGFNPDELPDPLEEENLYKPCGRVIFLIKYFMDKVDFLFMEEGSKIFMEKTLSEEIE